MHEVCKSGTYTYDVCKGGCRLKVRNFGVYLLERLRNVLSIGRYLCQFVCICMYMVVHFSFWCYSRGLCGLYRKRL